MLSVDTIATIAVGAKPLNNPNAFHNEKSRIMLKDGTLVRVANTFEALSKKIEEASRKATPEPKLVETTSANVEVRKSGWVIFSQLWTIGFGLALIVYGLFRIFQ